MDIYYFSFTVPEQKEGYLSKIKQFVAPYNAFQIDDGLTFEIEFKDKKDLGFFKNDLFSQFPFLFS